MAPLHSESFNKLKELISKAPVLAPFDSSKPIVVQADASQFGLGATLLQEGHPVSFASRVSKIIFNTRSDQHRWVHNFYKMFVHNIIS